MAERVAVVTGTAHGIGAAIARGLREDGLLVHELDKDTVDITDSKAVGQYFASLPRVDILVNNAGGVCGQTFAPIEEVSDRAWREVVDANLTGTFHCTRAAVPGMKERSFGRIVNISSGAGRSVSLTGIQAYASAKAAQIGFTRQMAHELGRFGITVNCIAPGFILSNPTTQRQWDGYGPEGQEKVLAGIAVGHLGRPEDIAHGVRFFCSEESSWITGQTLSIDGGSALF
ncbi:MAG: SDR family NAD(P)-dependent oxidoreductase [Candidatus Dormibacteraeota bacterium]|nr:SDR family NAD(P)-dependent oxidoreductase [Candidatus Dormibacteraeota bacterium]